jgi:TolB-like protein/Tfp pilus assembly protein PilF
MADRLTSWLTELRRRGVLRAAGLYLAGAWVAVEVAVTTVPLFSGPAWVPRLVLLLAVLGFPVVLVLAWVFDLTRAGVQRTAPAGTAGATTGARRGSFVLAAVVLLVMGATAQATYTRVSASSVDRSLAVLPFLNLAEGEDGDYFSDGLTEEILTTLAHVQDLRVISRNSVMAYKRSDKGVPQIARELGVAHVLAGSVRRDGDRIRVSVQLVRAATDENIWAEHYDGHLADIFDVQTDIARQIAGTLEARLTRAEQRRIATQPSQDPEAYTLYLRALEYGRRGHPDALAIAIDFLHQAIELDPSFATAQAQLALAYSLKVNRFGEAAEWLDSAVVAAHRALAIDPELVAGHATLGTALMLMGRHHDARTSLERAAKLGPSDAFVLGTLAILSGMTGDIPTAIRRSRDALGLDPGQAVNHHGNLSLAYTILDMPAEADTELRAAMAVQPDFPGNHIFGIHNALLRGDPATAIEHGDALIAGFPGMPAAHAYAASAHLFAGHRETARTLFERAYDMSSASRSIHATRVALGALILADGERDRANALFREFADHAGPAPHDPGVLYDHAVVAAARGELDDAVRWLQRAAAGGFVQYQIALQDPFLAPIRGDRRTQALLEEMKDRAQTMRREVLRNR